MKLIHGVARRNGGGGGLFLGIDRGEGEDVEDPGVVGADDEVDVLEVGPISKDAGREVELAF